MSKHTIAIGIVKKCPENIFLQYLETISHFTNQALLLSIDSTDLPAHNNKSLNIENIQVSDEFKARKLLWEKAVASNADSILLLDSNEYIPKEFYSILRDEIQNLHHTVLATAKYQITPDGANYLDSVHHQSHYKYQPFLIKNFSNLDYNHWDNSTEISPRVPAVIRSLETQLSEARVFFANDESANLNNQYTVKNNTQLAKISYREYLAYIQPETASHPIQDILPKQNPPIMVSSVINNGYEITKAFLESISAFKLDGFDTQFTFIDDSPDLNTSQLIQVYAAKNNRIEIIPSENRIGPKQEYLKDFPYIKNKWKKEAADRFIKHKNLLLEHARKNNVDFCFMLNSNVLLHPHTIQHLVNRGKDVIAPLIWTQMYDGDYLPNAWMMDEYQLFENNIEEKYPFEEAILLSKKFIDNLKIPQMLVVGGISDAILISKKILDTGIDFNYLYNSTMLGEDSHFCTKAIARGYQIFLDTTFHGTTLENNAASNHAQYNYQVQKSPFSPSSN